MPSSPTAANGQQQQHPDFTADMHRPDLVVRDRKPSALVLDDADLDLMESMNLAGGV